MQLLTDGVLGEDFIADLDFVLEYLVQWLSFADQMSFAFEVDQNLWCFRERIVVLSRHTAAVGS